MRICVFYWLSLEELDDESVDMRSTSFSSMLTFLVAPEPGKPVGMKWNGDASEVEGAFPLIRLCLICRSVGYGRLGSPTFQS